MPIDISQTIGNYVPYDARDQTMWTRLLDFVGSAPAPFSNDPAQGHVTGSAFVLSADFQSVLLTHHAKLGRWLQLGGHCDGVADVPFVALREAYEESGLSQISFVSRDVFDVDIHEIPARKSDPAHLHYDVRYLMQAKAGEIKRSSESLALAWVPIDRLDDYTEAASVLCLREKIKTWNV